VLDLDITFARCQREICRGDIALLIDEFLALAPRRWNFPQRLDGKRRSRSHNGNIHIETRCMRSRGTRCAAFRDAVGEHEGAISRAGNACRLRDSSGHATVLLVVVFEPAASLRK
jgi:hypothetical protein